MNSSEPQRAAQRAVEAHTYAETLNDVDAIMKTVSDRLCYVMPDLSMPKPELMVLSTYDDVRAYYERERGMLEVVDSAHIAEIATDWYVLYEGVATTRSVAKQQLFHSNHVVLFPVADDGIIGEYLWARRSFADIYAEQRFDEAPTDNAERKDIPWRRWKNHQLHDALVDALRQGDPGRLDGLFASGSQFGGCRSAGTGRPVGRTFADAPTRFGDLLGLVADPQIAVVNRLVQDWYVFAEWVLTGNDARPSSDEHAHGAPVEWRIASFYSIDDTGTFSGEIGYEAEVVHLQRG